jgi:transposase-like protein
MEVSMATTMIRQEKRGPGRRYSAQERNALLAGFEQFGGSIYAYAKRTGVTLVTLQRWLRREGHVSITGVAGGFVEFEVRPAENRLSGVIEVELPGGLRLRFSPGTDAGYIGRLVRELAR